METLAKFVIPVVAGLIFGLTINFAWGIGTMVLVAAIMILPDDRGA